METEGWAKDMRTECLEIVSSDNIAEVERFLNAHEESSQFLINNLRVHGPSLTEHHNSGNFKAIRKDGQIVSVFCLARRGNLNIQSTLNAPAVVLDACLNEPIDLKGFIGEWDSVEPVYQLFKRRYPSYVPFYESKEILYSYTLKSTDEKITHDRNVRFLKSSDFPQWLEFSHAYMSELGLPDELTIEQKQKDFADQAANKSWWGLFEDGKLISRAALNSKSDRIGQVGGVFTPKELRQKGFAKRVMFHMLKDCRDLHGHTKNILFTGETDIPAQKLYESIGYSRIGSFALILGR